MYNPIAGIREPPNSHLGPSPMHAFFWGVGSPCPHGVPCSLGRVPVPRGWGGEGSVRSPPLLNPISAIRESPLGSPPSVPPSPSFFFFWMCPYGVPWGHL